RGAYRQGWLPSGDREDRASARRRPIAIVQAGRGRRHRHPRGPAATSDDLCRRQADRGTRAAGAVAGRAPAARRDRRRRRLVANRHRHAREADNRRGGTKEGRKNTMSYSRYEPLGPAPATSAAPASRNRAALLAGTALLGLAVAASVMSQRLIDHFLA